MPIPWLNDGKIGPRLRGVSNATELEPDFASDIEPFLEGCWVCANENIREMVAVRRHELIGITSELSERHVLLPFSFFLFSLLCDSTAKQKKTDGNITRRSRPH
jgi:hypothetical protein